MNKLPIRQHQAIPTDDDEQQVPEATLGRIPTTSHVQLREDLLTSSDH